MILHVCLTFQQVQGRMDDLSVGRVIRSKEKREHRHGPVPQVFVCLEYQKIDQPQVILKFAKQITL